MTNAGSNVNDGAVFKSGVMTPIINNSKTVGYVKVAARNNRTKWIMEQHMTSLLELQVTKLKTPATSKSIKSYTELRLDKLNKEGNADDDKPLWRNSTRGG